MTTSRDPAWVAMATRLYAACLWLYPRALREAHGAEMRQAFRDRCREVARGRRSMLQCAAELAPDLLASATRSRLDAGRGNDARVIPGLVVLVGVALALATQPLWSGSAVNGMKAVESVWLMWREQREFEHKDAVLQRLASGLVANGTPEALATAALLHQGRAEQVRWYVGPALGDPPWNAEAQLHTLYFSQPAAEAAQLAGRVAAGHARGPALAIAAEACTIRGGCNVDFVIGRLLAVEPRNALGWMLAFKRAAQRGDAAAMQSALEGAAGAEYYDSYQARVYSILQRHLAASGQVDAETSAILAEHAAQMRQVLTADWHNDLRSRCSLGNWPVAPTSRWLEAHPEARASCLRVAGLLAGSPSDLVASLWGWRQLRRVEAPIAPEGVRAMRDARWMQSRGVMRAGFHPDEVGYGSTPWTAADWALWNASWAPGDGDVPSLRRWLRAKGIPAHAPADFDAFPPGG
jgi:hypothetical protein